MSKLATKIAKTPAPPQGLNPRGPRNTCFPLYGAGDLEDFEQVEQLRQKYTWREVQAHVDGILGVSSLPLEKFRYHWRRRCLCWPEDLRL